MAVAALLRIVPAELRRATCADEGQKAAVMVRCVMYHVCVCIWVGKWTPTSTHETLVAGGVYKVRVNDACELS